MQAVQFREGLKLIRQQCNELRKKGRDRNILFGVTGYVASGKSRFCTALRADADVLLGRPTRYLPFDLWINAENLGVQDYGGRFFLDDLAEAVRCIHQGTRFMVPRYDIVKLAGLPKNVQRTAQEVLWNGKSFIKCTIGIDVPPLLGSTNLYIECVSGYPYSLIPGVNKQTYLLDGTLIMQKEIAKFYDLRVFMEASWPMRIARMIRRFNRHEVFGATTKSLQEYVGFLVTEARNCADQEIRPQLDENAILVNSMPETLSNYLDLAYLGWLTEQPGAPGWVTREEVKSDMREYLRTLQDIHDVEMLSEYRRELAALTESKHLLALPNIDGLLRELSLIIH